MPHDGKEDPLNEDREVRPAWLEGIIAMELPVVSPFWGTVPDGRTRQSEKPIFPNELPV